MLNQQKYPASQLFLLMTLGPTIALIPFAERARGWFADAVTTIGRVPALRHSDSVDGPPLETTARACPMSRWS